MNVNTIALYNFNQNLKQTSYGRNNLNFRGIDFSYSDLNVIKSENMEKEIKLQIAAKKQFENLINKKGRLTKEEFENIGKYKKQILNLAYQKIQRENEITGCMPPKTACDFALALKKFLDENNPEGYKIISIGTSPDIIANAIKYLGADVAYVPVSSLRLISSNNCVNNTIKDIEHYPNLKKVLKYLEKNGINKDIDKKDEKIVIMDITHKGKTLKRFANLLSDYMGIDSDKILQIDLTKTLNKIDADNQKDSDKSIFEDKAVFNYTVAEADGRIGKLSSTPHFDILDDSRNDESKGHIKSEGKTDEELFEAFENYLNPLARAYNMLIYNEIDKMIKSL